MGEYSIGEAIKLLMEKSGWKPKATELRMREEWAEITGKTISKYTRDIRLYNGVLTIYSDVAALKQELLFSKQLLIDRINEYFKERVVTDIIIK
jgi:predicted nucleic acid-binding Zn ribbon protein